MNFVPDPKQEHWAYRRKRTRLFSFAHEILHRRKSNVRNKIDAFAQSNQIPRVTAHRLLLMESNIQISSASSISTTSPFICFLHSVQQPSMQEPLALENMSSTLESSDSPKHLLSQSPLIRGR